jgi:hypothetical protein
MEKYNDLSETQGWNDTFNGTEIAIGGWITTHMHHAIERIKRAIAKAEGVSK